MKLRGLTMAVLLLFTQELVSSLLSSVAEARSASGRVSHGDGSPCSDPEDAHHACGPMCACTCCRPRPVGPTPSGVQPAVVLSSADERRTEPGDLVPQDVFARIFQPPRA